MAQFGMNGDPAVQTRVDQRQHPGRSGQGEQQARLRDVRARRRQLAVDAVLHQLRRQRPPRQAGVRAVRPGHDRNGRRRKAVQRVRRRRAAWAGTVAGHDRGRGQRVPERSSSPSSTTSRKPRSRSKGQEGRDGKDGQESPKLRHPSRLSSPSSPSSPSRLSSPLMPPVNQLARRRGGTGRARQRAQPRSVRGAGPASRERRHGHPRVSSVCAIDRRAAAAGRRPAADDAPRAGRHVRGPRRGRVDPGLPAPHHVPRRSRRRRRRSVSLRPGAHRLRRPSPRRRHAPSRLRKTRRTSDDRRHGDGDAFRASGRRTPIA